MIENVGRTLTVILLAVGTAIALLSFKDQPINLGLDLQGGTRLEYSFDIQGARERGEVPATMSDADILAKTIDTIRSRIDPTGVREVSLRPNGTNRVVIELPGSAGRAGASANSALAGAVSETATTIQLASDADRFPDKGGVVRINEEQIRYSDREGDVLTIASGGRGIYGSAAAQHAAGSPVRLVQSDWIREQIENLGELAFVVSARHDDFLAIPGVDYQGEQSKMSAWMTANPGATLDQFNELSYAEGGPWDPTVAADASDEERELAWELEWYPFKVNEANPVPEAQRAMPVKIYPADSRYTFTGDNLAKVEPSIDSVGFPAVGFEMEPAKKTDFGNFTEENIDITMPVILNGVVETAPNINGRLPGGGIIQGRYTEEEVKAMVTILDSGSLKIKPTLEHEDKVGAQLGQEYVNRGMKSAGIALLLVLAFMWFYYRRLGFYAVISLLATSLLLMGGLAFVDATLTLPGIAGIILTVGMAVDANILIFDRVREELDKGRNLKQGTKAGFDKAFSAIFDANVTTLLTAIILYNVGTGPVRGFAVTLIIGILTSVFSALVITRLLVHFDLERGREKFSVGQWMVSANYDFLSKAKVAVFTSTLVVIGALALFLMRPDSEKLGIDFLGGTDVQVVTQTASTVGDLEQRFASIEDENGIDVQITPVSSSAADDGYTRFRIVSKLSANQADTVAQGGEQDTGEFEGQVRLALAGLLLESPVQVGDVKTVEGGSTVDVRLLFDEPHATDDLGERLGAAGITFATVTEDAGANTYKATGTVPPGSKPLELRAKVIQAFSGQTDTAGAEYILTEAIPSASKVGPAVVGELQNKAVLALLFSLFGIVMYIRVRFAEYSYGIAAIAALTHDVLVTLGALTIGNMAGFINGEINLPMIAVFLTIIGYSLNDTIVILDRVRENLPVMKKPLKEILNTSINQTLSRTILTSLTTFLAVAVMFVFNLGTGNVLESFSFAMIVGIISGTYSTIFIANPILLWLEGRAHARRAASGELRENDRVLHPAIESN